MQVFLFYNPKSDYLKSAFLEHVLKISLDGDRLGKVAGHVYVFAFVDGYIV